MKVRWRVAEAKKEAEMQTIYMMLAIYPLILGGVAVLIPYIGAGTAVFIYVIYLAYIVFRLQKIAEIDTG